MNRLAIERGGSWMPDARGRCSPPVGWNAALARACRGSERNVVVRAAAEIRRNAVVGGDGRLGRLVHRAPLAATTEHLDPLRHDLRRIALLTLLVLPLAGLDAPLDVDLPALR